MRFQSALPMKGATRKSDDGTRLGDISIRAPNERSDIYDETEDVVDILFQSALPMKGATYAPILAET